MTFRIQLICFVRLLYKVVCFNKYRTFYFRDVNAQEGKIYNFLLKYQESEEKVVIIQKQM